MCAWVCQIVSTILKMPLNIDQPNIQANEERVFVFLNTLGVVQGGYDFIEILLFLFDDVALQIFHFPIEGDGMKILVPMTSNIARVGDQLRDFRLIFHSEWTFRSVATQASS